MVQVVEKTGNLFEAPEKIIAHGVNCKGIFGAGVAGQMIRWYPVVHAQYMHLWRNDVLNPGRCYPVDVDGSRVVFNLTTQDYPGPYAKLEWITSSLRAAVIFATDGYGESTIAIPALGCGIGGLQWEDVKTHIENGVSTPVDFEVVVYFPETLKKSWDKTDDIYLHQWQPHTQE